MKQKLEVKEEAAAKEARSQQGPNAEQDNPVTLSEIIRTLDEKHRQEVMEHNQKLEAMRREYLNERQELSIRLVNAVQNQEVKTDSVTEHSNSSSAATSQHGGGNGSSKK